MRLPGKTTIPRLQSILASRLGGSSLLEWAERVTAELLKVSGQSFPPIQLDPQLTLLRKVTSVTYHDSLPERARLRVHKEGFDVEIDAKYLRHVYWGRFLLAHEIAHTYFYENSTNGVGERLFIRHGDPDLEWLCDYLVRSLLVPVEALTRELSRFIESSAAGCSIVALLDLSQKFSVPWQIMAGRLIEDTGLWRALVLLWKSEGDAPHFDWRLKWQTAPSEMPKEIFVPIGRRQESGEMKFPRAKGRLAKALCRIATEQNTGGTFAMSLNELSIGNLHKSLQSDPAATSGSVQCSILGTQKNESFEWSGRTNRSKSVLMAINLS
jgi:hypothetical protein